MAKSGTLVIKTIPLADAEVDGNLDSLDNQEDNPTPKVVELTNVSPFV